MVRAEPADAIKHNHLGKVPEKRDILKSLKEELELEHLEREERLKSGGIEAMTEDEKRLYAYQQEVEEEQATIKALVY